MRSNRISSACSTWRVRLVAYGAGLENQLGESPREFKSRTLRCFCRSGGSDYTPNMPYSDPDQQRKYQREWKDRRRQDWLAANGPCIDCGSRDDLEVDHVDAKTKIDHKVWSWSAERRLRELAKCVVRCEPCHKAKTLACHENRRGEKVGAAKLTAQDIPVIRASQLRPYRLIAEQYGVDESLIRQIKRRIIWKHILEG
jgi:hypothetical protein